MATAARKPQPGEPFYRAAYLRPLLATLRARGVDPAPLLAQAQFSGSDFDDPGACLSYRRVLRLCEGIRRAVPDPRLALEWGQHLNEHAHGMPGLAVITAPTVAQALRTLDAVSMLRSTAIHAVVKPGTRSCRLSMQQRVPLGENTEFILTPVAMMVAHLLRLVLGRASGQLRVELPFRNPAWAADAERFFGCGVRLHLPQIAFELPNACLARPNPLADAESHAVAIRQCQLERLRVSQSLRHRVTRHLADHIESAPTSATTAAALCISERTLRRDLHAEGTSFRELLGAVRMDAARLLLETSPLPVAQIAWRLGYAEATNFVRAFRSLLGVTPESYRRSLRDPGVC